MPERPKLKKATSGQARNEKTQRTVTRSEVHSKYKSLLSKVGQPLKHADQAGLRHEINKISPHECNVMGAEQKSRLTMWFMAYDPERVPSIDSNVNITEIFWYEGVNGGDYSSSNSPMNRYIPAKLQVISEHMVKIKLPIDITFAKELSKQVEDELAWIQQNTEHFLPQDNRVLGLYKDHLKSIRGTIEHAMIDAMERQGEQDASLVQAQIESLNSFIEELKAQNNSIKSSIQGLQVQYNSVSSSMEGLETQYHSVKSSMQNLEAKFNAVNASIQGIEGKYHAIHGSVQGLEGQYHSIHSSIQGLEVKSEAISSNIQGLDTKHEAIGSSLEELQVTCNTNTSFIQDYDVNYDALSTSIQGLEVKYGSMDSSVQGLEAKYNSLKSAIENNKDEIMGAIERMARSQDVVLRLLSRGDNDDGATNRSPKRARLLRNLPY